jgi:hypothetical protein
MLIFNVYIKDFGKGTLTFGSAISRSLLMIIISITQTTTK